MNEFESLKSELANLKQTLSDVLVAVTPKQSPYTFFEWLDIWLTRYKEPKFRVNGKDSKGLKNIKTIIRIHIKPFFKDCNLSQITSLNVQDCLFNIPTTRTRKYAYDIFHESLKLAFNLDLIQKDVMKGVENIVHKRKIGRALTALEQRKFLTLLRKSKYEDVFKFYLLTGVRKSELFLIKKEDVDLSKMLIHIAGTKTEKSNRYIPIFKQLEPLVIRQLSKTKEYLFEYSSEAVMSYFRRLKKNNNLTFRLHDLRHTFATRCLECGVSIKVVQKWLGHSSLNMTLNIYSHVLPQFEEEQINKFNLKLQ